MNTKLSGRLRITEKLTSGLGGFSLSIESKETRFTNISADIDISAHPEILVDVCFSPFKSEVIGIESDVDNLKSIKEAIPNAIFKEGLASNIPVENDYFDIAVMW